MITIYNGRNYTDVKFENLDLGDMFIVKPAAGVPDPEDAIIYLKIKTDVGCDNVVAITNGHLFSINNSVPVIKIDGELNWKMCN